MSIFHHEAKRIQQKQKSHEGDRFLQMFRRSKRDKERRRGSSFNTNDSSDESGSISSQTGSLKRASKLFGFGKKDKRKSLDNGKESPELPNHHDSNGLHVETNHHHGKQGQFSPVQENFPSVSPHHITPLTSNYINGRGTRLDIFVPSTPEMIAEKSRTISESSSLGFEFGTDGSSLNFQDFAADVLKATEEKLKGVDLKLPDLKSPDKEDTSRIVYIDRAQSTGDFGFTIRRSTIDNGSKIVHTIEPTGPDTYGLLPGDRVVEVNDENVENFRRDNIIEKIAKSGITVKLKVVPVPELAEFSARTAALQAHTPTLGKVNFSSAGSLRTKILTKKVLALPKETGDESEKQWTGADKVWLVHKSGFSSGALSKTSNENHDGDKDDENDEGGVDIKLDHGGEVIQKIDESSLEKVNHPKFDNAENLTSLTYLNESGCLHTLRQRYGGNLVHTYAGNNLIVIKPKHPLSAYTKQVMDMFRGCKQEDMPPHIFAMAQTSYRSMLASHVNQSIILQGNAGSGKSFNAKQLLGYLTSVTVSEHNTSIGAKLSAAQSIVESFISARTKLSRNATFAYNLYSLNFDVYGLVIGASIENYMFDKNRLTRVLPGESTFRIFYELLDSGDMPLLQELGLDLLKKEESIFFDFDQQFSTFERHQEKWIQLQHDLETLNISQHEIKGIISLLAAILLLNQAGVTVSPNAKPYFKNIEFAQKASTILGCKIEEIARIVFATPLQNRNSMRRSRSGSILSRSSSVSSQSSINRLKSEEKLSKTDENSSPKTNKNTDPSISSQILVDNVYDVCVHALEGLLIGLYIEAFTSITRLVNRSLQTVSRTTTTMNILDGPGFQNKTILGLPGSYEDLTKNYCREKIQWFMHYCSFTATLDRYNRETVGVSYEVDASCAPSFTVQVLDKLTVDRRNESADAKGIFWIIEEEALRPNSNELILVEKIKTQHITNKGSSLVSVVPELPEVFTVSHLQNTVKVAYNVSGWLRKVREHPAIKMAYSLLTESSKTHISDLYAGHQSGAFQNESNTQARFVGRKRSQSILISVKKNAAVMTVKAQTERLLEQLDRTTVHFVHCFLPDTRAGLIDPNEVSDSQEAGNNFSFDIPYVRKQFKSSYLLENMRLHRLGYPEHIGYPDFRRRFDILLAKEDRLAEPVLDEKKVVSDMVKKLEIDERKYKLGLSQVFYSVTFLLFI
ncbi:unconventional myosin-XVIIIa-like [Clytia hemisphaerica]